MTTKILRNHFLWLLAGATLLWACQPEMIPLPVERVTLTPAVASTGVGASPPQTGATEVLMNEKPLSPPFAPAIQTLVTQAEDDLARRLSTDPGQIAVAAVSSVDWPDGSLGCPKPGTNYTMMVVPGTRIRLKAGATVYEYHNGRDQAPFLCQ